MGSSVNRYDPRNIETMELVYGKGYMSAGGDAEVARIGTGIKIRNHQLLDIGCGLGGAAISLVKDHHARHVDALDIDDDIIRRAGELIEATDMDDRITLTRFDGGALPYHSDQFDVIYLTSTSCHLEDLYGFFSEIHRVLRCGGWVVGGEWFKAADNSAYRDWDSLLRERGLNFYFVCRSHFETTLSNSGFGSVSVVDRTQATTDLARGYLDRVKTELKGTLRAKLGNKDLEAFLSWTHGRYECFANGGMAYGHFRAFKIET